MAKGSKIKASKIYLPIRKVFESNLIGGFQLFAELNLQFMGPAIAEKSQGSAGCEVASTDSTEGNFTVFINWCRSLILCCFAGCWLNDLSVFGQADATQPRWLLVTTGELVDELEPLVQRRQQQGFEILKLIRGGQLSRSEWTSEFIRDKISELSLESKRPLYVLLVGDWEANNQLSYLPSTLGEHGRMKNAPTDHGYGIPNDLGVPTAAVGRIPARTAADVKQFVAKVIRFEDQNIGTWTNRLNLWIGHPGGNSAIEKKLGETIVQSAVNNSLSQLDLTWSGTCLIDFPNTPFSVDRKTFQARMQEDLARGECFTIYAGHSAAEGLWSEDQSVFARDDWARINIQSSPGVVLTTGCYSCQMSGLNGKGFLTESMLNPHGPVACMGAYAESYAAIGQLAMNAFVDLVARPKSPDRLGDYWHSITAGIGSGKMDSLTFWLYDQADGSRGKVPLDKQRLEHLEMWTLFGDPALRIPFLEPTLDVSVKAEIGSSDAVVEFDVPPELMGGTCELQVDLVPEKMKGKSRPTNQASPTVNTHLLDNRSRFKGNVRLRQPLENGELRVRVFVINDGRGALGVLRKTFHGNPS